MTGIGRSPVCGRNVFASPCMTAIGRLRPNDNRVSDHRTIIEPQRSPDGGWTQRTRGETTTSMTAEELNVGQARPEATIPECARRISYVPYPIRDSAAARAPGCADRLVEGFVVCRPAPRAHPGIHADQHRTPSAKSAQDSSRPAREVQLCAEHGADLRVLATNCQSCLDAVARTAWLESNVSRFRPKATSALTTSATSVANCESRPLVVACSRARSEPKRTRTFG